MAPPSPLDPPPVLRLITGEVSRAPPPWPPPASPFASTPPRPRPRLPDPADPPSPSPRPPSPRERSRSGPRRSGRTGGRNPSPSLLAPSTLPRTTAGMCCAVHSFVCWCDYVMRCLLCCLFLSLLIWRPKPLWALRHILCCACQDCLRLPGRRHVPCRGHLHLLNLNITYL